MFSFSNSNVTNKIFSFDTTSYQKHGGTRKREALSVRESGAALEVDRTVGGGGFGNEPKRVGNFGSGQENGDIFWIGPESRGQVLKQTGKEKTQVVWLPKHTVISIAIKTVLLPCLKIHFFLNFCQKTWLLIPLYILKNRLYMFTIDMVNQKFVPQLTSPNSINSNSKIYKNPK